MRAERRSMPWAAENAGAFEDLMSWAAVVAMVAIVIGSLAILTMRNAGVDPQDIDPNVVQMLPSDQLPEMRASP